MSQTQQLAAMLNKRQDQINSLRSEELSQLQEANNSRFADFKSSGEDMVQDLADMSAGHSDRDEAAATAIAEAYDSMIERAETLVKAEEGAMESSIAEAKALFDTESDELVKAINEASKADEQLSDEAKANFGFADIIVVVESINAIMDGIEYGQEEVAFNPTVGLDELPAGEEG